MALASRLRAHGIGVELYPDPIRLGRQLKYADQRGFRIALIAGEEELAKGTCQVKDLRSGRSEEISLTEDYQILIDAVESMLELD